jgi:prevent-host-death family protein
MMLTIQEAQARLAEVVAKAEAGEEVVLTSASGQPAVKLVPAKRGLARLQRHPALIGSVVVHDREALLKPLPHEEWGGLAD